MTVQAWFHSTLTFNFVPFCTGFKWAETYCSSEQLQNWRNQGLLFRFQLCTYRTCSKENFLAVYNMARSSLPFLPLSVLFLYTTKP